MAQLRNLATTITYIVLRVDFEPAKWPQILGDIHVMLGFIPNANTRG
jgi:hypothetical protein